MQKVKQGLEWINENAGKLFAWSTSLLVWTIFVDVIMRYVINQSFIWITELEIYFFAISFLFASGYAFKHNKHVRVDLFYARWSKKGKSRVNLIGGVLFLIPWCVVSIIVCWKYFLTSFKMGESSAQPGGLPALYILKFFMVLGFLLLLFQAIASVIESIQTLTNKNLNENETLKTPQTPNSLTTQKADGTWEL